MWCGYKYRYGYAVKKVRRPEDSCGCWALALSLFEADSLLLVCCMPSQLTSNLPGIRLSPLSISPIEPWCYRCFCYVSGCYCGYSKFKLGIECKHFYFCTEPFPQPLPPFVRQSLRIPPWPQTHCVAREDLGLLVPMSPPLSPGIIGEHTTVPGSEVLIFSDVQIVSFGAGRSHVGFLICWHTSPHFGIFLTFKHILTFAALKLELTTPLRPGSLWLERTPR